MSDWNDPTNDPTNYRYGIFYFNPNDDRIIVPKRITALGWTLNFANPKAYIALFIIVVAIPYLTITFGN